MPVVDAGGRALARVATIGSIVPIPDADSIERATVGGWGVVVRKGEFSVGDIVIYFEVDTALPVADPRFAFLAPRGVKVVDGVGFHVLKTARLRGVYSQGLVLPAGAFVDELAAATRTGGDLVVGLDVTAILGLGKFEPPMPVGGGQQAGPFLEAYAPRTDSERAQNLGPLWSELSAHRWYATEKIDGTSLTVVKAVDGRVRVCGRNWEIADSDNVYWNATRRFGLGEALEPKMAVQAEVAGPGIQGNPLRLPDVAVFVFDVLFNRQPLPRSQWPSALAALAVPVLDLTFPGSPEEAVEQVEALSSVVSAGRPAEGVVWHTVDGSVVPYLGRSTWKAINNAWLAKGR